MARELIPLNPRRGRKSSAKQLSLDLFGPEAGAQELVLTASAKNGFWAKLKKAIPSWQPRDTQEPQQHRPPIPVQQTAIGSFNKQIYAEQYLEAATRMPTPPNLRKVVDDIHAIAASTPITPLDDTELVPLTEKVSLNSPSEVHADRLLEMLLFSWQGRSAAAEALRELASRSPYEYANIVENFSRKWRLYVDDNEAYTSFASFADALPEALGDCADHDYVAAVMGMTTHFFETCRIGKKTPHELNKSRRT